MTNFEELQIFPDNLAKNSESITDKNKIPLYKIVVRKISYTISSDAISTLYMVVKT